MPDEDKNFGGSLVLDFRKWWRHVKTIYSVPIIVPITYTWQIDARRTNHDREFRYR